MNCLTSKRILLGITGGVAAYKAAELVRRLRERGAEVRVVMTEAAQAFITPLTLQALSGQRVHTDLLDADAEAAMGHIELARWADAVLVAPATADFLARLAQGRADDLLATLCLATRVPLAVAPAMNQAMWTNPATRDNLALLARRGVQVWGPAEGAQACGETGPGRLLEPELLLERLDGLFAGGALAGKRVLITAGPTREAIDPVRFLSNRSSGKMGYALAAAAVEAGAEVILVSGPVALDCPPGVTLLRAEDALTMYALVQERAPLADIFIATAAVADYRPRQVVTAKIKKDAATTLTLELERNPDILAAVAALPGAPFCVGFAAETDDLAAHARKKRLAKGLDLVAANWVGAPGQGFDSDDNALELFWEGGQESLPEAPKTRLARELIGIIARLYQEKYPQGTPQDLHAQDSA
ncbi:MAG: bifunctional phosphopantothenoylcysteine decarboxylase/phosphopantothenate--cysteine ligase CoaBC [Gammaproteobacteria bacterium]